MRITPGCRVSTVTLGRALALMRDRRRSRRVLVDEHAATFVVGHAQRTRTLRILPPARPPRPPTNHASAAMRSLVDRAAPRPVSADSRRTGVHCEPFDGDAAPLARSYTSNARSVSSLADTVSHDERTRYPLVGTLPIGLACPHLVNSSRTGSASTNTAPRALSNCPTGPSGSDSRPGASERDFLTFLSYSRVSLASFRPGAIRLSRRSTPMQTVRYRRTPRAPITTLASAGVPFYAVAIWS